MQGKRQLAQGGYIFQTSRYHVANINDVYIAEDTPILSESPVDNSLVPERDHLMMRAGRRHGP